MWVSSWKLIPFDKMPNGKKEDISLREKEKEIQKILLEGVNVYGGQITLNDMFDTYFDYKTSMHLLCTTINESDEVHVGIPEFSFLLK